MKLVVGLGNVGKPYTNTRHNVGFMAIDAILSDLGLNIESNSFEGDYVVATINDQKVMFIKPTTLVNLSGNCVGQVAKFYKIKPQDIIVIHDDLDLKPGDFKIKTGGSSGGHNGIKDIIAKLGSEDFVRFKIGIGHPEHATVVDHVLGKFSKQETELLKEPIAKTVEFVKLSLCAPINIAISKVNQGSK
ncbi:MAG: aminoacyl-tRNA hydrolase [Mycoplasmoidaceae bacterium]|nr:aminoacyl-tRNA hydrolase [Mycoplasmoidaceae bacterium]